MSHPLAPGLPTSPTRVLSLRHPHLPLILLVIVEGGRTRAVWMTSGGAFLAAGQAASA